MNPIKEICVVNFKLCVYPGESVKFLYITSVSQDPPHTRDLSTRQCEQLLIGMTPSHN